jgi:hypothetical protein
LVGGVARVSDGIQPEDGEGVLLPVVEGLGRRPVGVGDCADQVLGPGKRSGVDGILHQAALKVEAAGVDGEREHPTDGNHRQRHDHDRLAGSTAADSGHDHQYSARIDDPAVITNWAPTMLEIIPVSGAYL